MLHYRPFTHSSPLGYCICPSETSALPSNAGGSAAASSTAVATAVASATASAFAQALAAVSGACSCSRPGASSPPVNRTLSPPPSATVRAASPLPPRPAPKPPSPSPVRSGVPGPLGFGTATGSLQIPPPPVTTRAPSPITSGATGQFRLSPAAIRALLGRICISLLRYPAINTGKLLFDGLWMNGGLMDTAPPS